jgi:hypothetical protein
MNGLRLLIVAAGVAAGAWSILRWRTAVKIALLLLIVDGALRKWVFPGAQDLVYFAKDVFLLGAYIGFLQRRAVHRYKPPANPPLYAALAGAALVGVLQMLNPHLPNLLVGLLGFKAYFFYVPLLFVVPAAFESDTELYRFLRWYVLISIPVGLLAVLQFFSPSTSLINAYAWGSSDEMSYIATFGTSTYVRVTGTFSFITGFTSYLQANSILLLCLLGQAQWRLRGQLLHHLALGLTLLSVFMSGSRGPILFLVLLFPLYWWLAVVREGGSGATFGRLLLGLTLLSGFIAVFGTEAIGAFYGRAVSGASEVSSRLSYPFTVLLDLLPRVGLTGYGIGSTHQTAMVVTKGIPPYSWLEGLAVEAETGRVLVELGGVGFLFVYFLRLYMPVYALLQVPKLRTRFHRSLATAAFLFYISQIMGMVIFDVTAGIYFWFFGGLIMAALKLDKPVAAAARQAVPVRAPVLPQASPQAVPQGRWGRGA